MARRWWELLVCAAALFSVQSASAAASDDEQTDLGDQGSCYEGAGRAGQHTETGEDEAAGSNAGNGRDLKKLT